MEERERRKLARQLNVAAVEGDVAILRSVLEAGAEVDASGKGEFRTPLMRACARGNPECVEALLAAGANARLRDEDGRDPLMLAAASGCARSVRAVLGASDAHAVDRFERSAFMAAMFTNMPDAARALMGASDLSAKDCDGRTGLTLAALSGSRQCVALALPEHAEGELKDAMRAIKAMEQRPNYSWPQSHAVCLELIARELARRAELSELERAAGQPRAVGGKLRI